MNRRSQFLEQNKLLWVRWEAGTNWRISDWLENRFLNLLNSKITEWFVKLKFQIFFENEKI